MDQNTERRKKMVVAARMFALINDWWTHSTRLMLAIGYHFRTSSLPSLEEPLFLRPMSHNSSKLENKEGNFRQNNNNEKIENKKKE